MQQKHHFLLLPYKSQKREHLIKSIKRRISNLLPPEIKTKIAYTGKILSTCFNVKNQSKFAHQHNVVSYVDCPNVIYIENYIDENGRRISERIKDHNGRNLKSHILKHPVESGHTNVSYYDLKIKSLWKRKIFK